MRRATVEIVVDEATTTHYLICAMVVPSENPTPGPHDDADTRGRTTAGQLHRRDERRREPAADRGRRRAHTGRSGRRTCSPRRSPAARTGRSPGRLLAALAVHSAELGARRILVESCARDKQDLAALTGVLARVGAPPTVRARMGPSTRARVAGGRKIFLACADTAGGQLRRTIDPAGDRGAAAVEKREGRATTHNVRAPGLTVLRLFARTPSRRAGHSPAARAPHRRRRSWGTGPKRHRDTGRRTTQTLGMLGHDEAPPPCPSTPAPRPAASLGRPVPRRRGVNRRGTRGPARPRGPCATPATIPRTAAASPQDVGPAPYAPPVNAPAPTAPGCAPLSQDHRTPGRGGPTCGGEPMVTSQVRHVQVR